MLDVLIYSVFFIVGACVGSFSNVVAFRLPQGISLNKPPSTCFACGNKIRWSENIPIISFLLLRGKCKYCGAKIPIRDFFVELISAILYLLVGIFFLSKGIVICILLCLTISILIILSCIDLDWLYVPSIFLVLLCILGVLVSIFSPFGTMIEHIIGLCVGGGFLLLAYGIGYLIKKREVLGIGDIKLMSAVGLLLGWKGVLFAFLVAFISASIILLIIKAINKRKEKNVEYPFVPFLAFGTIVSIFIGNLVINWYLSFFLI